MSALDTLANAASQFVQAVGGGDVEKVAATAGALAQKLSQGDYIGATLSRITIYSEYTRPMVFTAADLKRLAAEKPDPNSPARRYGKLLKPTVIVESPLAPKPFVIAPYGKADPNAWEMNQRRLKLGGAAIVIAVLGGAFMLGRLSKR